MDSVLELQYLRDGGILCLNAILRESGHQTWTGRLNLESPPEERLKNCLREFTGAYERAMQVADSAGGFLGNAPGVTQVLSDQVIPAAKRLSGILLPQQLDAPLNRLQTSSRPRIEIICDGDLQHVPFEAVWWEEDFLSFQFAMSRRLTLPGSRPNLDRNRSPYSPRCAIVTDPGGRLDPENDPVRKILENVYTGWKDQRERRIQITEDCLFREEPLSSEYLDGLLQGHDMIVLLAHHEADGPAHAPGGIPTPGRGLQLGQDFFYSGANLREAIGDVDRVPWLLCLPCCHSGVGEHWQHTWREAAPGSLHAGLAATAVDLRIPQFIGTSFEVHAEFVSPMIGPLLEALDEGHGIGEALRLARRSLRTGQEGNPTHPGTLPALPFLLIGDGGAALLSGQGRRLDHNHPNPPRVHWCEERLPAEERHCRRAIAEGEPGFSRHRCGKHHQPGFNSNPNRQPGTSAPPRDEDQGGLVSRPMAWVKRCKAEKQGIAGFFGRRKVNVPQGGVGLRVFEAYGSDPNRLLEEFTVHAGTWLNSQGDMAFYVVDSSAWTEIRLSLPVLETRDLYLEARVKVEDPKRFLGSTLRGYLDCVDSLNGLRLTPWLAGRVQGLLDQIEGLIRNPGIEKLDQTPTAIWEAWLTKEVQDFGLVVSMVRVPSLIRRDDSLQKMQQEASELYRVRIEEHGGHNPERRLGQSDTVHELGLIDLDSKLLEADHARRKARFERELEELRLREKVDEARRRMELEEESFKTDLEALRIRRREIESRPKPSPPRSAVTPPWVWATFAIVLIGAAAWILCIPRRGASKEGIPVAEPVPPRLPELTNSLGLPFVRIHVGDGKPGILMSIYETRIQDYDQFLKEGGAASPQETLGEVFRRFPDQPVVGVNHGDAEKFCSWLTERERSQGRIKASEEYRLPSDREWSWAVGIGPAESTNRAALNPEDLDREAHDDRGVLADIYPWGRGRPMPGEGNFHLPAMFGDGDGVENTAQVGRYRPSTNGLHDLPGNVSEWCRDWWNGKREARVIRGGNWETDSMEYLRSARRGYAPPNKGYESIGFRMVLAPVDPAVSPSP